MPTSKHAGMLAFQEANIYTTCGRPLRRQVLHLRHLFHHVAAFFPHLQITPESLALLDLLTPPPEVLLLGCGRTSQPLGRPVQEFLRARGIAYEALDTVRTV